MNLCELEHLVQELNEAGKEHGVTVYLAGGAVRDALLGRPIKDLDFFVEVATRAGALGAGHIESVRNTFLNFELRDMWTEMEEETEQWTSEQREVYEGGLENYLKGDGNDFEMDVLIVGSFLEHFQAFPDSLSKVYIGPQGLHQSAAHRATLEDGVIWIRPGFGDRERRLMEKYGPGNQYGKPFLELKVSEIVPAGSSL